ncbi:MAG TPA: peptidylprolyl isomerase [Lacipirellulaceae bacterium]|nr:peptidylprolyl isomerase [Lacipirellulaceae bacterium]
MLRWRTAIWTSAAIAALATASDRASATVVRFGTNLGNIDVRLYDSATPLTVANFLNYVTSDRYDGTFIHRAPDLNVGTQQNPIFEPFVVQGGGYKLAAPPVGIFGAAHIPTFSPVLNEPGLTNARGTIAMAKLGGDPNSATSEWFFNMRNNAGGGPALDTQNGGFPVFGRVVGNGMAVLDAIQALPLINTNQFQDVPVLDFDKVIAQQNVFNEDAVILQDVRVLNIPAGDYNRDGKVDAADLAILRTDFGSTTKVDADGNGNGRVDGGDFLIWQRTLGQNFGVPAAGAVPEPAAGVMAAAAGMLALLRRGATRRPAARRRV